MINYIKKHGRITGSMVFGGYVREKSDIDYLVLSNDIVNHDTLIKNGFVRGCDVYDDYTFQSYVKDDMNVLLFHKEIDFNIHVLAVSLMIYILENSSKESQNVIADHKVARIKMYRYTLNLLYHFNTIKDKYCINF